MLVPRPAEGETGTPFGSDRGGDAVVRPVVLAGAVAFTLWLLATTAVDRDRELLTYSGTSFTGTQVRLVETFGECRPFEPGVKSVRNNLAGVHVTLFSDTRCVNPVAVISPTEYDTGLVEGDKNAHLPNTRPLSLLGQEGALSYITIKR